MSYIIIEEDEIPYPDYDIFTREEWYQTINMGGINEYDGAGSWIQYINNEIDYGPYGESCQVNAFTPAPAWATHVIWYAK